MRTGMPTPEGRHVTSRTVLILLGAVLAVATASPALAGSAGSEDAGRRVFEANCAMCHGADAAGMMGMHPSLRGAVDRLTREGVEVTIRNGRDTRPPMPAFEGSLSEGDIADVIAYLESLPSGRRNLGPGDDAGGGMMGDGGMMDGGMMMGGGVMMLMTVLLVLAFLALVVAAIVWLVREGADTGGSSSARQELDRRYAAGEVDRDEYLQRRRDLEG